MGSATTMIRTGVFVKGFIAAGGLRAQVKNHGAGQKQATECGVTRTIEPSEK